MQLGQPVSEGGVHLGAQESILPHFAWEADRFVRGGIPAARDGEACLKLSGVYAKQPLSGSWTAGLKFQCVCIGLSCYGIRGCHDGFWVHRRGSD